MHYFLLHWVAIKTCRQTAPDNISSPRASRYTGAMNYWFWLFIILPPLFVFSVTPETSVKLRVSRLLLAIAIGYVLANVALNWGQAQDWKAYEMCQSQFRDGAIQHHKECPVTNSGLNNLFFLYFAWIPTAGYVGFFELIWRWRHRDTIRALGAAFKGKWASNALIIFSIPVWLYVLVLVVFYISLATCNWVYPDEDHWFSPNDKCWFAR